MQAFKTFTVGETEYKLRLTTSFAIELENKLGCGVLEGLGRISELRVLTLYLWACLQPLNSGVTQSTVNGIYDTYIDNGGSLEDAIDVIMDVMTVSGFMKAEKLKQAKEISAIQETIMTEKLEQLKN